MLVGIIYRWFIIFETLNTLKNINIQKVCLIIGLSEN